MPSGNPAQQRLDQPYKYSVHIFLPLHEIADKDFATCMVIWVDQPHLPASLSLSNLAMRSSSPSRSLSLSLSPRRYFLPFLRPSSPPPLGMQSSRERFLEPPPAAAAASPAIRCASLSSRSRLRASRSRVCGSMAGLVLDGGSGKFCFPDVDVEERGGSSRR
jgi:hypothetical protein